MTKESEGNPLAKVVALGGGSGLHALLRGLNAAKSCEIAAITTVADDGGSSGRLRKDFNIPPPGDIRNCLVAMADSEPILAELFQYRFQDSIIRGHSFGNLFIAALTQITGDFRGAIERAREVLGVKGRVIPATETKVVLVAVHPDGSKSTGEESIAKTKKPVSSIHLVPKPPKVSQEICEILAAAELICIGPGSLYTNIMPNLLIPGMVSAINASPAKVVYVSNLMTTPGETDGFTLEDHLRVLQGEAAGLNFDQVIGHSGPIDEQVIKRYAESGSVPVTGAQESESIMGIPMRYRNLVADGDKVRHSPQSLAEEVMNCLKNQA